MKAMKKILSLVLCFMLLVSAVPVHAFAAEEGNVTNGTYQDGVWTAGGTGSITHNIDGYEVELSKTATPVAGMENTYDITMQVKTEMHHKHFIPDGAVVLVFDESNSMDYCASCGGGAERLWWEGRHESGCQYSGSVRDSQSRMYAAKAAARAFLATYAGTDANAKRMLALVTFGTNRETELNWVNVAGGPGKNGYDTALAAINDLATNGGTNLEAGLYQALQELGKDAISAVKSPSVVLLTDGAPTYRMSGNGGVAGDGSSGSAQNNRAAANRATAIKNGGAEVYTVSFGVADDYTHSGGPTIGDFLSSDIASGSGYAYDADHANELMDAFKAITEDIVEGLDVDGWTVTDPMPANVDVIGDLPTGFAPEGKEYTWTLHEHEEVDHGDDTTYIYSITYRITLDVQEPGFVEGQFYPANEPTTLNHGDEHFAFPVPGIKGVLPRTDVSVTKVWDDDDNRDGLRTDSVTLQLHKDGVALGQPVVLSDANDWSHTWTDLIEMSGGVEHAYTVVETDVEGYKPVYTANGTALTVTNVHESETKDVTVTKVWEDGNNQDGKRPASIQVQLLADGEPLGEAVTLAGNGNSWSYTWEDIYANANGEEIVYSVAEVAVPEGYASSVNDFVITNTYETETIDISGSKTWNDANDQDGLRPESITVKLLANGETVAEAEANEANGWSWSFTDLPKYAAGVEIEYAIEEVAVEGYESTVDGYNITNTHTPETVDVEGTKTWVDANNQDGIRPESITVNLLADGEVVETATVSQTNNWSWSFTDLPKYAAGVEIQYTIEEVAVEGYESAVNGYDITNTHTPETVDVEGTKTWNDDENRDGIRPESITVKLLADGEAIAEAEANEANGWSWSFKDLPKFVAGVEIEYAIEEIAVDGYESAVNGYDITNTHAPETLDISGSKTWVDANDQDGIRPESITVNLLADGEVVETATVSAAEQWAWSFTDLPKYAAGVEIEYAIEEVAVDGYESAVNGYDITNTHTPETLDISGSKTWVDGDNQDGIRPENITVNLLADGEIVETATVSAAEEWSWSFTDLPKYAAGVEIKYTIEEIKVQGYSVEIDGYNITNTHTPATVQISGSKTWVDADDQDGIRPESITINLMANGKTVEVKAVTEANGWAWSFTNLPKYENGVEIIYSIEEITVDGYTTEVNGFNITNTHTPETLDISGSKTWEDEDNRDGIRPETITVNLLADGQIVKTATVSEAEQWSWNFTDLPKYAAGEEIEYTVEEIEVEGYTTEIDGFNITNTHVSEVKNITATKVWDDAEDQDGKRPESIKVQLLADGEPCGEAVTITGDSWSYTWEDLYVYANGEEIVYTVEELDVPEDYDSSVEDFVITNSHKPETIDISGSKTWEDADDQDGIRPETITVKLFAGGELVKEAVVGEAEGWAWSFTDLPKFANGAEIAYTIEEEAVEGYEATVNGFDIVNTHVPGTVGVEVKKVWNDNSDMYKIRPASVTIVLVADGEETDETLKLNADNGWAGSFIDLPEKAAGKAIVYTVKELDVEGYGSSVSGDAAKGFTVTNDLILIPETGDETNILGYGLVMGISFIALIAVIVLMINDKKRYNK